MRGGAKLNWPVADRIIASLKTSRGWPSWDIHAAELDDAGTLKSMLRTALGSRNKVVVGTVGL